MLEREIIQKIKSKLAQNKILILIGPSENNNENFLLEQLGYSDFKIIDVTDKKIKKSLKEINLESITSLFEGKMNILLKEAQYLDKLQQIIELILFENLQINLICLCSYEPILDDVLLEALISQQLIIKTTSPTFKEIAKHFGLVQIEKTLEQRLIFGNNEEVFGDKESAIYFLETCVSKILKSTLNSKERINKIEPFRKLLQTIALSIGNHLSYNELGKKVGLDNETVERYIHLLEKGQVLIKIPSFSTGKKYELKKTHCFYFFDNGIRNALIKNYNDLEFRNDEDALWKNWIISEKLKKYFLTDKIHHFYFWITHTKQQIDLIEKNDANMIAYQIKWNKEDIKKFPKSFINFYREAKLMEINRSTYWNFLSK